MIIRIINENNKIPHSLEFWDRFEKDRAERYKLRGIVLGFGRSKSLFAFSTLLDDLKI